MKNKFIGAAALFAITGAALFAPTKANATLSYNDGDLLLGFRATGGTGASTDYIVNIGNASIFANATGPLTLSLGGIGSDLGTLFASWQNRSDLFWGVAGVQKAAGNGFIKNTLFVSAFRGTAGSAQSSPLWTNPSLAGAGAPALKIQSEGNRFALGTTGAISGTDQMQSTNSTVALIQPISQPNSYNSFQQGVGTNGSVAYGYFDGMEGGFGSGTSGAVLDLYLSSSANSGLAPSLLGTLSIDNGASVTFSPVPEPASLASLGLGAAVLAFVRRRRAVHA